MSSVFGRWVLASRGARIGLIAGLLPWPFINVLSAAIVVAVTIAKGWREATTDCALALVLLGIVAALAGGTWSAVVISGLSIWASALLVGSLTGAYGSLALALQVLLLIGAVGTLAFSLMIDDPAKFWESSMAMFVDRMQAMDVVVPELEVLLQTAPIMAGLTGALIVLIWIIELLLGAWWASGAGGPGFRAMFLHIRLGYVLGIIAMLAGVMAMFGLGAAPGNVLIVISLGFAVQGLAVVHWQIRARGWPATVAVMVYAPMALGFMAEEILVLATVGFVDNWYGLRRAAGSEP